MGLFTGIAGALADSCMCITQLRIKKLAGKVEFTSFQVKLLVIIVKKENTVDIAS